MAGKEWPRPLAEFSKGRTHKNGDPGYLSWRLIFGGKTWDIANEPA